MNEKIKVYIKINQENEIIEVGSDIFIENFENWIKIDEGNGDKYAHAQNQYLGPLQNDDGKYKYIYLDGKIIEK